MRKVLAVVLVAAGTLVAQDPVDARGWLDRGVQAFKRGQYQAAATAFERAVQADPSLLAAQLYLGTAYMQMYIPGAASPENQRVAASAHAAFQKVLGMDAGNVVAMTSDASLYLNEKNWDAAQAGYEKLTAIQPNNADHYYSLGFIAWSRWYPSYSKARQDAGMQPADPGPIPDAAIRRQLKTRWDRVLQDGLTAMDRALAIRPDYADAMAYENLLIRERADLRDTKEEWQADVRVADQWVQKALDL
ncbi:MAG TPA: tetratricopeptide repeat protein, partial [Candidatus Sulfopaludibacter sp.]|nr:tetratricopeptide repeat protein [Candidatus Sulfopaludibacter sp.]